MIEIILWILGIRKFLYHFFIPFTVFLLIACYKAYNFLFKSSGRRCRSIVTQVPTSTLVRAKFNRIMSSASRHYQNRWTVVLPSSGAKPKSSSPTALAVSLAILAFASVLVNQVECAEQVSYRGTMIKTRDEL